VKRLRFTADGAEGRQAAIAPAPHDHGRVVVADPERGPPPAGSGPFKEGARLLAVDRLQGVEEVAGVEGHLHVLSVDLGRQGGIVVAHLCGLGEELQLSFPARRRTGLEASRASTAAVFALFSRSSLESHTVVVE